MGVRFRATLKDPFAFLRVDRGDAVGAGIPDMPLQVTHRGIAVDLDGAEQLGQLAPPETARTNSTTVLWGSPPPDDDRASPGITRHRFGEGTCVYVAIPLAVEGLGGAWAKHLIRNAVAELLPMPILRANVPPGVEVVLNRQGEGWILHVVNCLVGQPNHVAIGSDRAALRQIEVELDAGRIGAVATATLVPDEPLAIAYEDGRYRLTIPFVGIHGVVALR
jgi:hypothetical protein